MPEWNKLPAEVQEMVVEQCNKNTRNSLRLCSKNSKILVDNTRVKSLYFLGVNGLNKKWTLTTKQSRYHTHSRNFATFEELQESLTKVLKSAGCIETLAVALPIATPPIKLMNEKEQKRLRVDCVAVGEEGKCSFQHQEIFSQIEPGYLNTVILYSDAQNAKIYDMEQVVQSEILKVIGSSSIREDQLLKLNAYEVSLGEANCSIHEYIKQCTLKSGTRMRMFEIGASSFSNLGLWSVSTESPSNRLILDVPDSELKYEVTFEKKVEGSDSVKVAGNLRYANKSDKSNFWRCDRSLLRKLRHLRVWYKSEDQSWNITVRSMSSREEKYQFQKFRDFQRKVDEIWNNADFIKIFEIQLTGSTERIFWKSRDDLLMVKELTVEGDHDRTSVRLLLKEIDSKFLLDVTIDKDEKSVENHLIQTQPQIRNAYCFTIPNPFLTPQNLLEMDQYFFNIAAPTADDSTRTLFLSDAVINQFLKKCLRNVGKKPINFNLGKVVGPLTTDILLEGLEIIGCFNKYRHKKQLVINANHSEYVMNLTISRQLEVHGFVSYRNQKDPCYKKTVSINPF